MGTFYFDTRFPSDHVACTEPQHTRGGSRSDRYAPHPRSTTTRVFPAGLLALVDVRPHITKASIGSEALLPTNAVHTWVIGHVNLSFTRRQRAIWRFAAPLGQKRQVRTSHGHAPIRLVLWVSLLMWIRLRASKRHKGAFLTRTVRHSRHPLGVRRWAWWFWEHDTVISLQPTCHISLVA